MYLDIGSLMVIDLKGLYPVIYKLIDSMGSLYISSETAQKDHCLSKAYLLRTNSQSDGQIGI